VPNFITVAFKCYLFLLFLFHFLTIIFSLTLSSRTSQYIDGKFTISTRQNAPIYYSSIQVLSFILFLFFICLYLCLILYPVSLKLLLLLYWHSLLVVIVEPISDDKALISITSGGFFLSRILFCYLVIFLISIY
jgi:hypothetical protein